MPKRPNHSCNPLTPRHLFQPWMEAAVQLYPFKRYIQPARSAGTLSGRCDRRRGVHRAAGEGCACLGGEKRRVARGGRWPRRPSLALPERNSSKRPCNNFAIRCARIGWASGLRRRPGRETFGESFGTRSRSSLLPRGRDSPQRFPTFSSRSRRRNGARSLLSVRPLSGRRSTSLRIRRFLARSSRCGEPCGFPSSVTATGRVFFWRHPEAGTPCSRGRRWRESPQSFPWHCPLRMSGAWRVIASRT